MKVKITEDNFLDAVRRWEGGDIFMQAEPLEPTVGEKCKVCDCVNGV